MEALRKLERVQRTLSSMEARGLSTGHHHADRFLAHFLLFLAEPCWMLNVEKKCDLISENLPKISFAILEDKLLSEIDEDCQQTYAELPSQLSLRNAPDLCFLEGKVEDTAKIGFDAMQRANSTLEDFCRSYFMFHGMNADNPKQIFKFLPMLSFTESYIYQLDTMNEKYIHLSSKMQETNHGVGLCHEPSEPDPFDPLVRLLQCHGLVTERIRTELESGSEYWALERKLCHALKYKQKILIDDVMRAMHLKSFDYRVLNLLLYQLRGQQVDELHMEFLSISEFLVEISDDLYDYEDDVMENSFNILRMFVGIYGASLAPRMLAKCITDAEEKYEHLSTSLSPDLSSNYWRRCVEATKEGGKTSGHALGAWSIPPIIMDEESYRMQDINLKPQHEESDFQEKVMNK